MPISIGETLYRVIWKTVCMAARSDIEDVCGIDQFCTGWRCRLKDCLCLSDLFDANINSTDGWGILLVHASLAFNSPNSTVNLLHACALQLRYSCFLFNCYCGWSVLVHWGFVDFSIAGKALLRLIPYQSLCVQLGHCPSYILCVIQSGELKFGMYMMLVFAAI